jgi:hypothetical protein
LRCGQIPLNAGRPELTARSRALSNVYRSRLKHDLHLLASTGVVFRVLHRRSKSNRG